MSPALQDQAGYRSDGKSAAVGVKLNSSVSARLCPHQIDVCHASSNGWRPSELRPLKALHSHSPGVIPSTQECLGKPEPL